MILFNIPVSELTNQNVSLRHLIGSQATILEESLLLAESFPERVSVMESFLMNQIRKHYKPFELSRITNSINLVNISRGLIRIDDLASRACLSRKQYERTFKQHIGTSPKQFLKTVRFQHALHKRQIVAQTDLGELAFICGYYDQAHMTNDFKNLTGMTPKQFFKDCDPFSDYFS